MFVARANRRTVERSSCSQWQIDSSEAPSRSRSWTRANPSRMRTTRRRSRPLTSRGPERCGCLAVVAGGHVNGLGGWWLFEHGSHAGVVGAGLPRIVGGRRSGPRCVVPFPT